MATIGYGTTYEIFDENASSGGEFREICDVYNLSPSAASADRVDITSFCSPGRRREYIAGLLDQEEGSFEMNWVPGSDEDVLIRNLLASGNIVEHRITFPPEQGASERHRVTFEASVTGIERQVPVDDRMTSTVTIQPTGDESWDTTPVSSGA